LNYLAHLYLSENDPESLIGSLMGDFLKGRVGTDLAPAVRRGVLVHRRIDSFTDAHMIVGQSKRRIGPAYRRYAGILIDLFYDHFLASRWSEYSAVPLEAFAARVYRIVAAHHHRLSAPMQRSMSYMISNELLQSYRTLEGMQQALRGIESRLKRPSRLHAAVTELERNYTGLGEDFAVFFPDLVRFASDQHQAMDGHPPHPVTEQGRR